MSLIIPKKISFQQFDLSKLAEIKVTLFPSSPSWVRIQWKDGYRDIQATETVKIELTDDYSLTMRASDLRSYAEQKLKLDQKPLAFSSLKGAFVKNGQTPDFSAVDLRQNYAESYHAEKEGGQLSDWISERTSVVYGGVRDDKIAFLLNKNEPVKGTFYSNGGQDKVFFVGAEKNYTVLRTHEHDGEGNSVVKTNVKWTGNTKYTAEFDLYGTDIELGFIAPLRYLEADGRTEIDYWPAA